MIRVKQIRQVILHLPDDAVVLIKPHDTKEAQFLWRYQTRELELAYSANDDRYEPSPCLLLELGEWSEGYESDYYTRAITEAEARLLARRIR